MALGFVAVFAFAAWALAGTRSDAAEVTPTPDEQSRYLSEMKAALNGHPDRPRFHLLSSDVLVKEGIRACEWLAAQPGDKAPDTGELRAAYISQHPDVLGAGPFEWRNSALRQVILTNSWGWLCVDIAEDRIDRSPVEAD